MNPFPTRVPENAEERRRFDLAIIDYLRNTPHGMSDLQDLMSIINGTSGGGNSSKSMSSEDILAIFHSESRTSMREVKKEIDGVKALVAMEGGSKVENAKEHQDIYIMQAMGGL